LIQSADSSGQNEILVTSAAQSLEDKRWERRRGFSKSRSTGQLPQARAKEITSPNRAAEAPEFSSSPPQPASITPAPVASSSPPASPSTQAAPVVDSRPKDFVKRSQTAKEILSTERSYLESLKTMIEARTLDL